MTFTSDEATQTPATGDGAATPPAGGEPAAGAAPAGGDAGGLEGIGGADVRAARHPLREDIYAVQQIYALRGRRLEFSPNVGVSLNDPYVSHTGVGIGLNYWVSNVLSAGLSFMWFQGLNARSDVDFHTARSAGLVVPINEYQLSAAVNFSYVPVYGKFLMFNQYIFHWDIYIIAGIGLMRTRPIPDIDPEVRTFDWGNRLMFNAGVGVRVFANRWFGIVGEVRNYIYQEQLENRTIAVQDAPVPTGGTPLPGSRQDPATWTGDNVLTDNVMVQVGLTIFLPFDVSYRLQK